VAIIGCRVPWLVLQPEHRMPFVDYAVTPTFLLSFAGAVLSVISAVFKLIVAIGPIGQVVLVAIPVALFCRDIYAGPQAFKNIKG
jgi:hypothetical protein